LSAGSALITGGAGFIGAALGRALLDRGWRVTALDDLSVGTKGAVAGGVELVVGDIRDRALVARLIQPVDVVFHLAARVTIRGSVDAFVDDHDVNLGGTLSVLEAMSRRPRAKLVLASSMAVYADALSAAPIPESHPTLPLSPYGASKLAAEHYARLVCGRVGVEQIALRYFNTYGPGQTPSPYVGVVTIFIERLLRGEGLQIFGDGAQVRDFVHLDDVVEATIAAARPGAAGPLNIGTGRGTSVLEIARELTSRLNPKAPIEHLPTRPEELRHSVASIERAREVLGYAPRHPALEFEPVIAHWRQRLGIEG